LVAEGERLLTQKDPDPKAAINKAKEAEGIDPQGSGAVAFLAHAEEALASETRSKAAQLFEKDPAQALGYLDRAIGAIQNETLLKRLKRERRARNDLLTKPKLAERVAFVPELPLYGCRALYLERTEVTNGAFKAFVDAKGYDLTNNCWEKSVTQQMLDTFVDTTGKPGPRG